jgi:hypothetical protein
MADGCCGGSDFSSGVRIQNMMPDNEIIYLVILFGIAGLCGMALEMIVNGDRE